MPFPLTFLAGKTFAHPTYRNPIPSLADLILSHYAIKGPRNQSTETILQTFDHVTEGTVAHPPLLISLHQIPALCLTNLSLAYRLHTTVTYAGKESGAISSTRP